MKLSELIYENEYVSGENASDISVNDIASDTGEITEGCVFVCIAGMRHNTHSDISEVVSRGAAAVVCEKGQIYTHTDKIPVFEVENSRLALSKMWSRYYKNPHRQMKMIGVTGTNGKTSVCHYISSILTASGMSCAVIGTNGAFLDGREIVCDKSALTMTTPDPKSLYKTLARMRNMGARYTVMEVSSHSLALEKVAPIYFDIGVFTNLSPEHLDFHNSMEEYALAKSKLFSHSKCAVVNADDPYTDKILNGFSGSVIRCSTASGNAVATGIRLAADKTEYTYISRHLKFKLQTKIAGLFTVYNTLLACAAVTHLGISAVITREVMKYMKPPKGRMESVATGENFSVIIDYAHTERALASLLHTVKKFSDGRRIVTLFGCGGDRDKSKRAPMGKIACELSDSVIITSDNSRSEDKGGIISDILSGITSKENITVIEDRKTAIHHAIITAREGDIILLVGKGHEEYEIDGNGVHPFSEREIVRSALKERRKKCE